MAKKKIYKCTACGQVTRLKTNKCKYCNSFNTMEEQEIIEQENKSIYEHTEINTIPKKLNEIKNNSSFKLISGIKEVDSIFGGGIVNDSVSLISGAPGIGKSTLLLQISEAISKKYGTVLYVTGEESGQQVKNRAERLKINLNNENLLILQNDNIEIIENIVEQISPIMLIVDSIQTLYSSQITSNKGSSPQIKYCNNKLIHMAKYRKKPLCVIIVGHIVKDGNIAGPKELEHDVDSVFEFEGDNDDYRMLRSKKNRFGSTNEIAIFEMTDVGLKEAIDTSLLFVDENTKNNVGCSISCGIEGNRALLTEIQTLVIKSNNTFPKRMAQGYDYNRLNLIAAILEKKCNVKLGQLDIYLNVVGGLKITDRTSDLAIAISLLSSLFNSVLFQDFVFIGELGLSGELRTCPRIDSRLKQIQKIGIKNVIIPKSNKIEINNYENLSIYQFSNILEIFQVIKNKFKK